MNNGTWAAWISNTGRVRKVTTVTRLIGTGTFSDRSGAYIVRRHDTGGYAVVPAKRLTPEPDDR